MIHVYIPHTQQREKATKSKTKKMNKLRKTLATVLMLWFQGIPKYSSVFILTKQYL